MAATEGWRARLAHVLRRELGDLPTNRSNVSNDVLQVKHGWIYVWNNKDHRVIAINVHALDKNDVPQGPVQNLVPTCPPLYEIHGVVCNPSGQRLALVGRNGVNVMELPKRPKKPIAPSDDVEGRETVNRSLCSSLEIAERFFLTNSNCWVLQAKWHPQSDTSTHLIILFSNNYLRVYDCLSPSTPLQVYQLGPIPVFRLQSGANSFGAALGDTAVDFDFGRPLPVNHVFDRKLVDRYMDQTALVWPVYILGGNGDIFSMWMTDPKYSVKSEVKGPLTMHPPAEDNYGVDATSIVCLPSVPAVLAIATGSGMLYHAIVLDNDPGGEEQESLGSEVSWSNSSRRSKTLGAPDVSLYVYESVELELIPNPGSTPELPEDDLPCPIRLHKDPTTMLRYHCSHSAGVHTVALPIITQLEYLTETNQNESISDVFSTIESQTCIIEHLVCTRPMSNSPSSPVIGLGVVHGHSLGGTVLLCLTDPNELLTLPLVPTYLDRIPNVLMEPSEGGFDSDQLPVTAKEPFDQHIRLMLQRKISNPIFKSNTSADLTPEECIQLLNRSTRILREEYIEKLDLAREKILERVKVLRDLKAQQLVEITMMNKLKGHLATKAENMAERYEDLRDNQEAIVKRVERVLRAILKQTPMLSDAERDLGKELKIMEQKMKHLTNSMQQIRAKQDYQATLIARHQTNLKLQRPSVNLKDSQLKLIKDFLADEGRTLKELTEKMKMIQRSLGL